MDQASGGGRVKSHKSPLPATVKKRSEGDITYPISPNSVSLLSELSFLELG